MNEPAGKPRDRVAERVEAAKERAVVQLFQLGYGTDEIAKTTGMPLERVHRLVVESVGTF